MHKAVIVLNIRTSNCLDAFGFTEIRCTDSWQSRSLGCYEGLPSGHMILVDIFRSPAQLTIDDVGFRNIEEEMS